MTKNKAVMTILLLVIATGTAYASETSFFDEDCSTLTKIFNIKSCNDLNELDDILNIIKQLNIESLLPNYVSLDSVIDGDKNSTITWDIYVQKPITANATHFKVLLDDVVIENNLNINSTEYVFTNLTNNIIYKGNINAVNTYGIIGIGNDGVQLHPEADPHIPNPPVISVVIQSQTSIKLNIIADDGNAILLDFIIEISDDNINWVIYDDGINTNEQPSITNLTSGQLYYLRVSTVVDIGTSDPSNIISALAASVPHVNDYDADAIGSDYVDLSWVGDGRGSPILSYTILYQENSIFDDNNWIIVPHDASESITILGLIPDTIYRFSMFATNSIGDSSIIDDEFLLFITTLP